MASEQAHTHTLAHVRIVVAAIPLIASGFAHAQAPTSASDPAPVSESATEPSATTVDSAAPASADIDSESSPLVAYDPDALRFSISPYLWAASIDGTVSNKGLKTSFDVPFSDVISNLDLAFMLHAEIAWRRLFIFGDFEYIDLSSTTNINEPLLTRADLPKLLSSIPANDPTFGSGPLAQALLQAQGNLATVQSQLAQVNARIATALEKLTPAQRKILAQFASKRLDAAKQQAQLNFAEQQAEVQAAILAALAALSPGPELNSVESSMTLTLAEFGGGYQLLQWQLGRPWSEQHALGGMSSLDPSTAMYPVLQLDLLAGARYYNMGYDSTISFTPDAFQIIPSIVESDQRYEWVDAIVGGRVALSLDSQWRLWCRGDVGGFQSRQNSWCVQGGIEWAPVNWFRLIAGYRALHIDYQAGGSNGFGFDGTLQGPVLGCTLAF